MPVIDTLPLYLIFLLTLLLSLASMLLGIYAGKRKLARRKDDEKGSSIIFTSQLTVAAFMIAFIFGIATNRFDLRKNVLLDESNSIGTTYLRTDFLPEPQRTEIRMLLKEYVNEYIKFSNDAAHLNQALKNTDRILDRIWKTSASLTASQPDKISIGIFIQSLNETIDLHAKRVTVNVHQKIPPSIWITLYLIAAISMFVTGIHTGVSGGKFGVSGFMLAVTFTLMISTISDLDRGAEGMINISNAPFIELKQKIDSEVN